MSLAQSRLTTQGQISVPARVRHKLGLGAGSTIEWREEGELIVVRRAGRYTSEDLHAAVFAKPPRRRTLSELRRGLNEHARASHARG